MAQDPGWTEHAGAEQSYPGRLRSRRYRCEAPGNYVDGLATVIDVVRDEICGEERVARQCQTADRNRHRNGQRYIGIVAVDEFEAVVGYGRQLNTTHTMLIRGTACGRRLCCSASRKRKFTGGREKKSYTVVRDQKRALRRLSILQSSRKINCIDSCRSGKVEQTDAVRRTSQGRTRTEIS